MIKTKDVIDGLAIKLKSFLIGYKPYFNDVKKASGKVIDIELISKKSKQSINGLLEVNLLLDILVFDENIKTVGLLDISDLLDEKLGNTIELKDTVVTINEIDSNIVDNILHYIISVDYSSIIDSKNQKNDGELMGSLHMKGV